WNYNDEIVNNDEDGIVMKNNTPEMLADAIIKLISNWEYLNSLRYNSYLSGEKYLITNYVDEIIENL
ncbi:MAG TPA: glycosyltransferase, partial [Clostridia bacterium]